MKSLLLFAALCATTLAMETNAPASTLPGTSWTVTELNGIALEGDKPPTIEFDTNGNIGGNASCNRYGGACTIAGNTITVSRQRVTRMVCDGETMKRERQFLGIIQAARTWEITGNDELILSGPEGSLKAIRQTSATTNKDN